MLALSLTVLISLNSMIRLHLKTPFLYINPLNINFPDLDNWFGHFSNFDTHNTRWSNLGCLNVPSHRTKLYGRNSVCISAILTWHYLQNLHRNILFHKLTPKCLTKSQTLLFLRKYV